MASDGTEARRRDDAPASEEEIRAVRLGEPKVIDGPITLVGYDLGWPLWFEREAGRVRAVLGDQVLHLEHVGSTSVPGLAAKPVIDMLLALDDTTDEDAYVPPMEAAGYVLWIREPDWFEHRLFKGPDTDINLHVLPAGCREIERMLAFRDHLRSNEEDRRLYERTKQELAARRWKYIQNYADAKTTVVEDILTRALPAM
jgi:GrpB-like predicted nucleotidyltransferase (UPF0157 family)